MEREKGCTCTIGTTGNPVYGGYARCPIHDPNMNEEIEDKELTIIICSIKSWTIKDQYDCPTCKAKLGYPFYTCHVCHIKIKPVMNF